MMESNIAFGILIAVFFISLIVLFCVLIVKLYINKIKTYTKVIYEKDLEFQRTLNTTIIETQEQVLTNISQDLHDDAGQQLTYINFQLENLKLDSPDLQNLLAPVSQSLSQLSTSVRRISHSLNNHLIMQQDLIRSIRSEAERINSKEITVTMHSDTNKHKFDNNQHIVIYRIFQEIINNILKHAKANAISININASPFKMVVTDNGRGFDMNDQKNKRSLGMHTMRQRATLIGYDLQVNTEPGKGTVITLKENLQNG